MVRRSLIPAVIIIVLACAFYLAVRHKRDLVDFQVYRTAATRALAGETLYRADDGHWQFKYLPAFALLMAPFAALPAETARAVWFAVCVVCLLVFLHQSAAGLPARRLRVSTLMWITALLLGKCFVKELMLGQTNLLLGVTALGALGAARRRQPVLAGVLVGVAVFIKPYALILIPWMTLTQGAPALAACAGVMLAGLALPALAFGWHGNLSQLVQWFHTVTDTTAPNLLYPENISFATMWAKWIGPTFTAKMLALLTTCLALCAVGFAGFRRKRVVDPDFLEVGLLLLLVPVISPQGWDYVVLLGAPVVMALVDRWPNLPGPWRAATGVSIAILGFTIFDLLGRAVYSRFMEVSIVSIGCLLCMICGLYLRERALG